MPDSATLSPRCAGALLRPARPASEPLSPIGLSFHLTTIIAYNKARRLSSGKCGRQAPGRRGLPPRAGETAKGRSAGAAREPRLSELAAASDCRAGSAAPLCGRALPFRPNAPFFFLLRAAVRLSLPAARRRLVSGHAVGKAQPFRKAGGRAASLPRRPQSNLDKLGSASRP